MLYRKDAVRLVTGRLGPHRLRCRRVRKFVSWRTGQQWAGTVDSATRSDRQTDGVKLIQQRFNIDHVQLTDDEAVQHQQLVANLQA